jgi:NADH:ubiquinone oxidoreductase subunit H
MFAVTAISVIPVGPVVELFGVETNMGQADISIGLLLILGLTGMGVYGMRAGRLELERPVLAPRRPAQFGADGVL